MGRGAGATIRDARSSCAAVPFSRSAVAEESRCSGTSPRTLAGTWRRHQRQRDGEAGTRPGSKRPIAEHADPVVLAVDRDQVEPVADGRVDDGGAVEAGADRGVLVIRVQQLRAELEVREPALLDAVVPQRLR